MDYIYWQGKDYGGDEKSLKIVIGLCSICGRRNQKSFENINGTPLRYTRHRHPKRRSMG